MKQPPIPVPDFFSPQVLSARRFYLDLNPPRDTPLAVVCGGMEECAADYAIHRETFPFHSLEYVVHGEGQLRLGWRQFKLLPGAIFSYGPGISQHIVSDAQKPLVKYFVDFTGTIAAQWLRQHGLPPGQASRVFPPSDIQPLFDELIRSGQRASRRTPELCRLLLEALGIRLLEARAPLKDADSLAFTTYQTCREYIRLHYRHLHTLRQVARECHLDAAYICRLF